MWVEDGPQPVLHGQAAAPKDPYVLELPNGDLVNGGWYSALHTPTLFPGHLRHFVEDWSGDRFAITAYTPRGRDALSRDKRDLLRSFGFPVGRPELKGRMDIAPADREATVRPKKSIRKKLWKQALQASAMLTLSMSTASSYFGEFFSKPLEDGPAILEIGGMSMTSRVADWGRDVVEPIEHARFFEEGGVELATNLTNSLAPQVLWLHTTDADFNFIDKARSVLHQQLSRGGVAVLDGDLQDVSWDANAFKEEFSSYRVTFEQGQTGSEITLRPAEEGQRSAVDQEAFVQDVVPPEAAAPASDPRGASAISFDPEVPQHVGAALARLHQNLGHPENRDLTRHLRYAGADQAVLKASKSLKCQTCARCKRPAAPKPATLPSLLDFNQMVSLDVVHVFDSQRVRHELLSVIDHSTTFHLVKRIQGHSSADFEAGFVDLWGRVFGPPKTIFADLETGLQAGLSRYAEFCGSKLRAAAGQAHWQVGNVERHGRWYQEMLQKVVDEQSVTEADIDLAVVSTCAAKNELRRKHGFSPSMAVFGREPRYPEELEGGHDDELFMEILSSDRQRQREVALRTAARVAFFQTRQDSKFRRALIRRARVHRGGFVIGSRSEGPRMAAGEAQELSWAKKVEISGSVLAGDVTWLLLSI